MSDETRQAADRMTACQFLAWEAYHAPEPGSVERAIERFMAALASARAEGEAAGRAEGLTWQPIETAPRDGTEILLTNGGYKRTGWWARRANCWSVDAVVPMAAPTHWMPLPAAPAGVAPAQTGGEQ